MSDVLVVEETGCIDHIPEYADGLCLRKLAMLTNIPLERGLASFHEDVDVVAGLREVDEVDDVGMLYLLANDHF